MITNADWLPTIAGGNILHTDAILEKIPDDDALRERILQVYHHACGEYGKETFASTTLPRAFSWMGHNYRSLIRQVIIVIDEAKEKRRGEIDAYLETRIPLKNEETLERCVTYREDMVDWLAYVVQHANNLPTQLQEVCNVVGVVLYGSMATETNHLWSDADFETITTSTPGKQIHEFEQALRQRNVVFHETHQDDVHSIYDLGSTLGGEHDKVVLISPHQSVIEKLQNYYAGTLPECIVDVYEY